MQINCQARAAVARESPKRFLVDEVASFYEPKSVTPRRDSAFIRPTARDRRRLFFDVTVRANLTLLAGQKVIGDDAKGNTNLRDSAH